MVAILEVAPEDVRLGDRLNEGERVYKITRTSHDLAIWTAQGDRYEAWLRAPTAAYDGKVTGRFYPPPRGPVRVARP